jgi:hypothetical protein
MRLFHCGQGLLATLAGTSAFAASVASIIPEPAALEVIGKWPVPVVLGAVCVVCVYFMYRQSKDNADRTVTANKTHCDALVAMAEGERLAAEKRTIAHATMTKELAESNAKVTKELAESNAREIRTLIDELVKHRG